MYIDTLNAIARVRTGIMRLEVNGELKPGTFDKADKALDVFAAILREGRVKPE